MDLYKKENTLKKMKKELEFISHINDTFVTKLIKTMNDCSPDIQMKTLNKYSNKT